MAKVPNSVETLPKISTDCTVGCTSVTDRQTDRQTETTDGQATAYSERERSECLVVFLRKPSLLSFCLNSYVSVVEIVEDGSVMQYV